MEVCSWIMKQASAKGSAMVISSPQRNSPPPRRASMTGSCFSSNILSDRLHKLQAQGLVAVITHPDNRRRKLYYLTAAGKDLIRILVALAGWSYRHRREAVAIPAANRRALKIGRKAFVDETLARLESWERAHGVS